MNDSRVAIVTGGAGSIGSATARKLAAPFLLSHELAHVTLGHLDISRVYANADALSILNRPGAIQSFNPSRPKETHV